jgi:hypothetical protein
MSEKFTKAGNIEGHEKFVDEFEQTDFISGLPEQYVITDDSYYANYKTHKKLGSNINKNLNEEYIPVVGGLIDASKIGRNEPDVFYKMLAKKTHQNAIALYGNTHDISCKMLFVRTDHKQLYKRVFKLKLKVQPEYYDLVHKIKKGKPEVDANTRLVLMTTRSSIDHFYKLDRIRQKAERASKRKYDRHKLIKRATPRWADHRAINIIYSEMRRFNAHCRQARCSHYRDGRGVWHVDHKFPLVYRGKDGSQGSGLHIHQNLKIILAKDNQKKSNRRVD